MKKIFLAIFFLFLLASPAVLASQNLNDAFKVYDESKKDPTDEAAEAAGYNINVKEQNNSVVISNIIAKAINTVLGFLGIIFMALIIYAGGLWMTAAGNDDKINKAKDILKRAAIGMAVILFSYLFSYFVISKLAASLLQ